MTTPSQDEAKKSDTDVNKLQYSLPELAYRKKVLSRIQEMYELREQKYPQFNDMTYAEWDDRNVKADISYIPPARNKGDTRIVTGITREKDNSLLSTALSNDYEGNITAYDQNDRIIDELGENIEDLVRKTREIEDYDNKRGLFYRSFIARGTSYYMEVYNEKWHYDKVISGKYDLGTVSGITWTEIPKKIAEMCETIMLDPRKVYLGDMREFFIQKQPDVAIVDDISYEEAYSIFSQWERWKYVPKTQQDVEVQKSQNSFFENSDEVWGVGGIKKGRVQRVVYLKKVTNEIQIFLNGVMMLPVMQFGVDDQNNPVVSGFPLTAISPVGDYPIVKADFEPVENFAISKGCPSKLQVDQAVHDEFYRLLILGAKAMREPARVNNSGRILTQSDFLPGSMVEDVPEGKVYSLHQDTGLTQADFSFYQLIKTGIEEKSVSGQYQGMNQEGGQTATEILENKKQQLLNLAILLDSVKRFERDLYYLRINNILTNLTTKVDGGVDKVKDNVNEVYRSYTIDKNEKGGGKAGGRKIITFSKDVSKMKEQDPNGHELHQMGVDMEKKTGVQTVPVYIDPEALRNFKGFWYVVINSSPRKDDNLSRMLFVQNIREAQEIFGPESLQAEKLKQRFASVIGESFDTWFKDQATVDMQAMQMMESNAMMGGNKQQSNYKAPNNKPAMKTVLTQ